LGIHPVEGIPILMEDTQNPSLKKALQSIAQEAMQGVRLYECFERAKVFPGIW
jgi:type II secretory pathway component PulF